MPTVEELPDSLRQLSDINACEVGGGRGFWRDIEELVRAIDDRIIEGSTVPSESGRRPSQADLIVPTLGKCRYHSPSIFEASRAEGEVPFVSDKVRILAGVDAGPSVGDERVSFEKAGPRGKLFFDPAETTASIVSCGGLSPGANSVIRSLYLELVEGYGVAEVLGIRNGFHGLARSSESAPVAMSRDLIRGINDLGGTVIGTSRGPYDIGSMVESLDRMGIGMLFCTGGDGTLRGAASLHDEILRRGLEISVIGIPTSVEDEMPLMEQRLGYASVLEKVIEAIRSAVSTAGSTMDCITLLKVPGRHSGRLAAGAVVASSGVDVILVPEVEFPLEGSNGLLTELEKRIGSQGYAVVVASEGAGIHLASAADRARDPSGNVRLPEVGSYLRHRIRAHFEERGAPVSVRYSDSLQFARSGPAIGHDRLLADQLARHAAHAAAAGKSGIAIGRVSGEFVHIPLPAAVASSRVLDLKGQLWRAVLQVTGQPRWHDAMLLSSVEPTSERTVSA